jgi:hypothetical protein
MKERDKATAPAFDVEAEENYWRENYANAIYVVIGENYADYEPAYRYGWEATSRYVDLDWEDIEEQMERGWEDRRGASRLPWTRAKHAVRDAWDRVKRAVRDKR